MLTGNTKKDSTSLPSSRLPKWGACMEVLGEVKVTMALSSRYFCLSTFLSHISFTHLNINNKINTNIPRSSAPLPSTPCSTLTKPSLNVTRQTPSHGSIIPSRLF
jgi:hypothetical protein